MVFTGLATLVWVRLGEASVFVFYEGLSQCWSNIALACCYLGLVSVQYSLYTNCMHTMGTAPRAVAFVKSVDCATGFVTPREVAGRDPMNVLKSELGEMQ